LVGDLCLVGTRGPATAPANGLHEGTAARVEKVRQLAHVAAGRAHLRQMPGIRPSPAPLHEAEGIARALLVEGAEHVACERQAHALREAAHIVMPVVAERE